MIAASPIREDTARIAGRWVVVLLVVLPPLFFLPGIKDAFRLPKSLLSEWLALCSVVFLSWGGWRSRLLPEVGPIKRWLRSDPALVLVPLWLSASLGFLVTDHRHQFADAWWSLTVGVVCVLIWSHRLPRIEGLLRWTVAPALVLCALAIVEYHGWYDPLKTEREGTRLAITSLAGNVGDLGLYLVPVTLIATTSVLASLSRRRWVLAFWLFACVMCLYAIVITQAITAILGLAAGLAALAFLWFSRRGVLVGTVMLFTLALAAVFFAPVRERVTTRVEALAKGDFDTVLTGRLDGWRAALWMTGQRPLLGMGLGAYAPEFNRAKLALIERGVPFYTGHGAFSSFANAHNEYLEVAAEMGLLGALALGFAALILVRRLARADVARSSRALATALVVSTIVISSANFPFRVGFLAYPLLLVLAWILGSEWSARPAISDAISTEDPSK